MAVKTVERALCPDCEKNLTEAHLVHKKVPYTEGTAVCEWCRKKRYVSRYKIRYGK